MGLAKLVWNSVTGGGKRVKRGKGAEVLRHTARTADGREAHLSEYRGNVLMVVNVASKCGFTPQYEQLVALQEKYGDQGFQVLAFPANDFMGQEPGSDEEIVTFCRTRFDVNFPVFSKITTKGDDAPPLYRDLTSTDTNSSLGGAIAWNFTKFIIGRDGQVVARAEPQTKPDDPKLTAIIEEELSKTPSA